MNLREMQEEREERELSDAACKSKKSRGRARKEEPCEIRTEFQRDRDRILHCKAFRRMKQKTQVFISPEGDHYRTRLTHTLEVSQIARTIARALCLNEDLTEAIALGHDLGHTPFGHSGEAALDKICPFHFEHCSHSLRVVDKIEKNGAGLNLTWEVRNGILNHRSSGRPETLEGKIVQLSDKIAYLNHDIDDAERAGVLTDDAIPKEFTNILGHSFSARINAMVCDTVSYSLETGGISMAPKMYETMQGLRKFMFQKVYLSRRYMDEMDKVENILCRLYEYYEKNWEEMHEDFRNLILNGEARERVACDYVAGMTDRFATKEYTRLFIPKSWDIY